MTTRTGRPRLNRSIRSRLLACSLTSLLAACHGGGHSSNPPPPEQPGPSPTTSSGGTVTSSDGKATVTIPAGALSQDTVITATATTNVPAGNVGTAYEFGPSGTTFSQAVTIEITYDPASLPSGVTDADLVLAKVVNGQWEPIADSGVQGTTAGVVSGSTTSFSVYGLLPQTPTGLTAVPADGQVTLDWDPVPLATSYNIYWTSPTTTQQKIAGVVPPYVHAGLVNGTPYTYQVSAQKPIGEGGLSQPPVVATPQPAGTLPAQPQNLSACAGNQQVQLSWDAASDATFYRLRWDQIVNGTVDGSNSIENIDTTVYVHTNLTNEESYEYFVEGVNGVGTGPLSAAAAVTLTTLPPPQSFAAQSGVGNVTLSWNAVPCADSYTIHWEGGGLNDDIAIPDPATVEYTHAGLQDGTTYNYVISSINALGTGAASVQVSATPQAGAVPAQISTGAGFCVAYSDGSLRCVGANPGDNTDFSSTAVTVPGITDATDVSTNGSHTCAVDGGLVKCWGLDSAGQLGDGSTANSYVYTPVTVNGITAASRVAAGYGYTCAIDGGTVKCWGGGLGSGTFDPATDQAPDTLVPLTVSLPAAAMRLATAWQRALTCAVLVTNETWCWGYDFGPAWGVGLDPNACDDFDVDCAPALATNLGPAFTVTIGHTHACYLPLLSELGVACVGYGQAGAFSEGLDPVIVFDAISAGVDFNCGIASGGIAYCWGLNTEYQLGDGTNAEEPITTAVAVTGVNNATSISAGANLACAIDDGVVKCWGDGSRFVTGGSVAPTAVAGF